MLYKACKLVGLCKLSDSMKGEEFVVQLGDCRLLKKDSAPRSS